MRYGDISSSSGTQDIVAVHDADNGCPSGRQYTVATFSGPGTAFVALPYGTWTFEILTRVALRRHVVDRDRRPARHAARPS